MARSHLVVPLLLGVLVLTKTVLQLGLYFIGYRAYAADDFARTLSAAYWLRYQRFDLGSEGFLGLTGSGWLPLPDYLFALGLALHPDLFLTPKVVNLAISAAIVVAMYFLGRELFGRFAGLLAAALFAFQPWHVWIGVSGMTSDLPSVLMIVVFGLFLCRWLRTGRDGALLAAAASLGVANGIRYENWTFALVFSLLVVSSAVVRWKQHRLSRRTVAVGVGVLLMVSAIPVGWMTASYLTSGELLPGFRTNLSGYFDVPFAKAARAPRPMISLPLLALGSFPFELALSLAGVAAWLVLDGRLAVRTYVVVPILVLALFAVVVKGQLPADLMNSRFFLPHMALLLPFAGLLLVTLVKARQPWGGDGMALACLIVVAVGFLNIGRAFNYPDMFPRDAIVAGQMIRGLQDTGAVQPTGKILIERAPDFGHLGIVVPANGPERFVTLDEFVSGSSLPSRVPAESVGAPMPDIHGSVCQDGFHDDVCRRSVLREEFTLVILSSPERTESFENTFDVRSWTVGNFRIFDMSSLARSDEAPGRIGQESDGETTPLSWRGITQAAMRSPAPRFNG